MDERLMKAMLELDEHHWWYRGRRRIIRAELDRLPLRPGARVLDAGCGSGRTLEELSRLRGGVGDRARPRARPRWRVAGDGARCVVGRLEELPWEDGTFDLITCLDVIEHTPDDRVTLRRAAAGVQARRLAAGDRAGLPGAVVAARRRQPPLPPLRAAGACAAAARDAGWRVVRMTSFNGCCWPPAAAVRLAERRRLREPIRTTNPNSTLGPEWLNAVLEQPLRLEARWLAARPDAAGRPVAAGRARESRRGRLSVGVS